MSANAAALAALPLPPARPSLREADPDGPLLDRLRRGEEAAFAALVERYGPLMRRLALTHVRTAAIADEVVQETWLGVLEGLDRFEGRSTLKTWVLRILVNQAKTRGVRESRCLPFCSAAPAAGDGESPAVDVDRFEASGPRRGAWSAAPADWDTVPGVRLQGRETLAVAREAIAELPPRQAQVVVMRDVHGCTSPEVCAALGISEGNQRVLLHRGRAAVRAALESHLG